MPDMEWYGDDHREVCTPDGAKVTYLDRGEGEVIVLLHGYPQSHLTWRRIIETLSKTHRVIAPDWVGWGRSERRVDLPCDYDSEVARLAGFLEALGLEKYNLFAHDYGGYLALGLHRLHRQKFLRLAILNSRAHRTFPGLRHWLFAAVGWFARIWGLREIFRILPVGWLHRGALSGAGWARLVSMRAELPPDGRDDTLLQAYTGWMDTLAGRLWFRRFYADYRTRERPELVAELDEIKCPTAVIWGDEDPWCPISIAEDLVETIDSAVLTPCPGIGHFVMEAAAPAVLAALERLLSRKPPNDG